MLLETLDVKKNDIVIFSENKFDFENNFKIIYKKAASRKPFNITFWEVGEYINSPNPKNMILYRLLTNIPEFNANLTKFGTFIRINNLPEIVYYDPIFAVKELERLNGIIDFHSFRFKIHQIGLTSSTLQNGFQNYRELYHFDLKAEEAKNQNDKVFAEAIFAFDQEFSDETQASAASVTSESQYKPLNLILSEDKGIISKPIQKLDVFPDMNINSEAREKINFTDLQKINETTEHDNKRPQTSMAEFLRKQKGKQPDQVSGSNDDLLSLFKSANNFVSGRSAESVILQIKKKEE